MVVYLGHFVILSGNLKIGKFRGADGKTLITLVRLEFKKLFFLNKISSHKLYEPKAMFEQLFSERKVRLEDEIHI
jgi:hypothetical protein